MLRRVLDACRGIEVGMHSHAPGAYAMFYSVFALTVLLVQNSVLKPCHSALLGSPHYPHAAHDGWRNYCYQVSPF